MIRVRIAPTPSGKLHLGTAHTCLFNFLFSRHNNGKLVLRIDDSDPKRSKKEFEADIIKSLKWLGINWDEGPDIGGPYAPYRESERKNSYQKYLKQLLDSKNAYYCFCTKEELEAEKLKLRKTGKPIVYSGKCRNLDQKAINQYLKEGRKPVIRLKVPPKTVSFTDPARGLIKVHTREFGDFVIARADYTPLLVFAVTIDDIEMKITHTIRGEDYLNIVPKQIVIYEVLGLKPPIFSHLPFVYAADGSKLSKRHGATGVSDYKDMGYLPEAIINYLALLGWHPEGNREILSKTELIKQFTLEKVNTNAHRFDINKLNWINGHYIRQKSDSELLQLIKPFISSAKLKTDSQKLSQIIPLIKKRINILKDADELIGFFGKEAGFEKKLLLKKANQSLVLGQLAEIKKTLANLSSWKTQEITKALVNLCDKNKWHRSQYFMMLRIVIAGKPISPPLSESMEILGKNASLKRINLAIKKIS